MQIVGKPGIAPLQQASRDFLQQRSAASLRREIQNLVDSYSHPWDVLSELVQNSVDAIHKHRRLYGEGGRVSHELQVIVDRDQRAVRVRDTGIGFSSDRFLALLAPHGSDKQDDPQLVGEKGVGLTYTIFVCNRYSIETRSVDSWISGSVVDGARWRVGKSTDVPQFVVDRWESATVQPSETFTDISLEDVEQAFAEDEDIFAQSPRVLEFLLRTRTAIGSLSSVPDTTKVTLVVVEPGGVRSEYALAHRFMWPEEFLPGKTTDLDTFKSRAATLNDRQKARELAGKALTKIGSVVRAGREIRFHAVFAPSRTLWREISEINEIVRIDAQGTEHHLYTGGIYVGSKGMPTGIELEHPATGSSGYWPNFFMLLEDDQITFDVGRKSVPGRTKGMLKEIAQELFEEFRPYMGLVSQDPAVAMGESATVLSHKRNERFRELKQYSDLGLDEVGYLKHPDGQEAAVMALFHELVGAGVLLGYGTYRTGLRETYDLWGRYRIDAGLVGRNAREVAGEDGFIDLDVVLEFKFAAHRVLVDFDLSTKQFPDIDLIVCWDVDESKFKGYDVKVEMLPPDDVLFYGSNYRLNWAGAYNLGAASQKPVLALRKFIQDHIAKKQQS